MSVFILRSKNLKNAYISPILASDWPILTQGKHYFKKGPMQMTSVISYKPTEHLAQQSDVTE